MGTCLSKQRNIYQFDGGTEDNGYMNIPKRYEDTSVTYPKRVVSDIPTVPNDITSIDSHNGSLDTLSRELKFHGSETLTTGTSRPHWRSRYDAMVSREDLRRIDYKEMVNIFKPLIIQNLLIHEILPHLPFLETQDEIYDEVKHSERKAVCKLLYELEQSNVPDKWHMFMDALNACGYTYIVDNIRGYRFINHRYQREYIKILTPKIGKMISPPELIPYLMVNDVLSDTDKEHILCECSNRGNYAGAVLLLDRITRKHGQWYMLFIKSLEEANYFDVAENLQIKELMDSGRVRHTPDDADDDYLTVISNNSSYTNEEDLSEKDKKFKLQEEELRKLEEENQELGKENELLEKRLSLHDDYIQKIKKKDELHRSVAEKEKEREMLKARVANGTNIGEKRQDVTERKSFISYSGIRLSMSSISEMEDTLVTNDQTVPKSLARIDCNESSPLPHRFKDIEVVEHRPLDSLELLDNSEPLDDFEPLDNLKNTYCAAVSVDTMDSSYGSL